VVVVEGGEVCGWLKGDANRRSRSVWPLDLIVGCTAPFLSSFVRYTSLQSRPSIPIPSPLRNSHPLPSLRQSPLFHTKTIHSFLILPLSPPRILPFSLQFIAPVYISYQTAIDSKTFTRIKYGHPIMASPHSSHRPSPLTKHLSPARRPSPNRVHPSPST
jgi:hypothetical protein